MNAMVMIVQLLLSLSILVAVHELGHLLTAKYFGMRVEQFSIGFPPKIWSFTKGETEYAISAIPLGGYVKISGMIDESLDTESLSKEPQPWEFRSKPAWQRLIVMLGGIFVNIIVGILIFIGLTYFLGDTNILKDEVNKNGGFAVGEVGEELGLRSGDQIIQVNGHDFKYLQDIIRPQTLLENNASYTVVRNNDTLKVALPADVIQQVNKKESLSSFISYRFAPVVKGVADKSIASRVGLKEGDRIIEVNGMPIRYYDELHKVLRTSKSEQISFKVDRAGQVLSFENEKFSDPEEHVIGFQTGPSKDFIESAGENIRYGFFESIPLGTQRAFTTLLVQIKALGKVVTGVLSPRKSLSGPIGIAQAFGGEFDWGRFWSLTGVLSLVLAFMNLLPIPALDGGHVMFLSYEIISRRKPSDKFLETAQKIGMVFLLALMVFIFANDIINWVERYL